MAKISSVISASASAVVDTINMVNDLVEIGQSRTQKWVERERIVSSYNSYDALVEDFNEISTNLSNNIAKFNNMHPDNQIDASKLSKAMHKSITDYAHKLNIEL